MTFAELVPIVAVGVGVYTVGTGLMRFGMDYLTTKFGKPKEDTSPSKQAEACRFDHTNISALIASQNASIAAQNVNIAELLKQNARSLDAMKDHSHVMELRHQILIAKMDASDKEARNEAKAILDKVTAIEKAAKYGD